MRRALDVGGRTGRMPLNPAFEKRSRSTPSLYTASEVGQRPHTTMARTHASPPASEHVRRRAKAAPLEEAVGAVGYDADGEGSPGSAADIVLARLHRSQGLVQCLCYSVCATVCVLQYLCYSNISA